MCTRKKKKKKKKNPLCMLSARCLKPLVCGSCTTNRSSPPCPIPSPLLHCICSMCVGLCVWPPMLCAGQGLRGSSKPKTFPCHLTQIAKLGQMAYGQVSRWLRRKLYHVTRRNFRDYIGAHGSFFHANSVITTYVRGNESGISLVHVLLNMPK